MSCSSNWSHTELNSRVPIVVFSVARLLPERSVRMSCVTTANAIRHGSIVMVCNEILIIVC